MVSAHFDPANVDGDGSVAHNTRHSDEAILLNER